jgi:hypothetical protein
MYARAKYGGKFALVAELPSVLIDVVVATLIPVVAEELFVVPFTKRFGVEPGFTDPSMAGTPA